jgi:hypothetical protein
VLRDVRIAMVYEGTNEIQAIDLVQRKIVADEGAGMQALLEELEAEAAACAADAELAPFSRALSSEIDAARAGTRLLVARARDDRDAVLALADAALQGLAHTLLCWCWARSARCARDEPDHDWAQAKLQRMRYAIDWLLPAARVHWRRVAGELPALPELQ